MSTKNLKKKIIPILKRQAVVKAAVFGSFARGESKKKSDIDLLVKFKGPKSLLDVLGLEFELEEKVGKKFDLVEYQSVHPRMKKSILEDEIVIYEKRS